MSSVFFMLLKSLYSQYFISNNHPSPQHYSIRITAHYGIKIKKARINGPFQYHMLVLLFEAHHVLACGEFHHYSFFLRHIPEVRGLLSVDSYGRRFRCHSDCDLSLT